MIHRPYAPTPGPSLPFLSLLALALLLGSPLEARVAERLVVETAPGHPVPFLEADVAAAGDGVVFFPDVLGQSSLWASQGFPAETELLLSAQSHPFADPLKSALGLAFFPRPDGANATLWRSDGTAAGTFDLGLPVPMTAGSRAPEIATIGSLAFVFLRGGSTTEIWRTDGTAGGTVMVTSAPKAFEGALFATGDRIFFTVDGVFLWVTDGTAAGTAELGGPFFDFIPSLAPAGDGYVFFVALGSEPLVALFRTDGTPEGTGPVGNDLYTSYAPRGRLVPFQGSAYFTSAEGLWQTDGTVAGTTLVHALPEQEFFAEIDCGRELVASDDRLFYFAPTAVETCHLWTETGDGAGSSQVALLTFSTSPAPASASDGGPRQATVVGDEVFFTATDEEILTLQEHNGLELWSSDGTPEGTALVHDLEPGAAASFLGDLTVTGEELYLTALDSVLGRGLWVFSTRDGVAHCRPTDRSLCLQDERFRLETWWRDFQGRTGPGRSEPLEPDTGSFWFFRQANVEMLVKVLDGRPRNAHHWVFYGSLSNVEYWLTVTDTSTGEVRRYHNPLGTFGSVGDTRGFGPLAGTTPGLLTSPILEAEAGGISPFLEDIPSDSLSGTCIADEETLC